MNSILAVPYMTLVIASWIWSFANFYPPFNYFFLESVLPTHVALH